MERLAGPPSSLDEPTPQQEGSECGTQRSLPKSASWFNSLSRRASRKSPAKKRSLGLAGLQEDQGETRPRLNKSDWDVSQAMAPSPAPPLPAPASRSTDCLDLDATTSELHGLELGPLEEGRSGELVLSLQGEVVEPSMYYTIDSRRLASKHKKSQHDRKLLYGVKQFNLEASRGLAYLGEAGLLTTSSPEAVARFLYRQERLSKKQIGRYLGSHEEFQQSVLAEFVRCHEFSHLLLVQALRQFLWSFRLPGEAMQIDRVMDSFSAHYCAQNPNIFEERDTCFILSFSIIMLNTALHNPNAKMKITSEQFVKQNKGINSGKDLPNDMLEAIFSNIKEEPFKIPDETYDDLMYTFFSPEREGWLEKQGGNWKNWKRRWFVLNDRCLYYFQHTAENSPKGIIPLEGVKVRPLPNKNGKDWVFEIFSDSGSEVVKGCKTDSHGAVVQGNHKQYRMAASSQEERDEWIRAIEESIEENPFCRIIEEKKASRRHMEQNAS